MIPLRAAMKPTRVAMLIFPSQNPGEREREIQQHLEREHQAAEVRPKQ